MSNGLYIHVPFCQKRCIYCDFYSTTCGADVRRAYVDALCHELTWRAGYLPDRALQSIYFGGGTPSQLSPQELEQIFKTISQIFSFDSRTEITMEVNPDDFTEAYAAALAHLPVNRISMGVQSFDDAMLRRLNRRHDARQAVQCVERAHQLTGNVSIDLIYGLPEQTLEQWKRDLRLAATLPVAHISAYALSYEEGTPLWRQRQSGQVREADEELSLQMYTTLMDWARASGFEHYEISNFARPGYRAVHNSGYWADMNYLGCGPAAHSFNGRSRRWNLPDLKAYIAAGGDTTAPSLHGEELLDRPIRYDETVMKRLRTREGISLPQFAATFGPDAAARLLHDAQKHIEGGRLELTASGDTLRLTRDGIFVSDDVMSDLFISEN